MSEQTGQRYPTIRSFFGTEREERMAFLDDVGSDFDLNVFLNLWH